MRANGKEYSRTIKSFLTDPMSIMPAIKLNAANPRMNGKLRENIAPKDRQIKKMNFEKAPGAECPDELMTLIECNNSITQTFIQARFSHRDRMSTCNFMPQSILYRCDGGRW